MSDLSSDEMVMFVETIDKTQQVEFSIDSAQDICIAFEKDGGACEYIPIDQAQRLRDWLNKVLP